MKLVDILASELKHWPSTRTAAVGQSNSGSLHLNEEPRHGSEFFGWTTCKFTMAEDCQSAWVTRAEWQAAVDALNAPKVVEWDEVGLPPVGEKVEVILKDSTLPASLQGWKSGDIVECVAHVGLYGMLSPLFLNRAPFLFSTLRNDCYRPIRTAAKVAAEEREKAIKEICIDAGSPEMTLGQLKVAEKLYMAGYRKQVTK